MQRLRRQMGDLAVADVCCSWLFGPCLACDIARRGREHSTWNATSSQWYLGTSKRRAPGSDHWSCVGQWNSVARAKVDHLHPRSFWGHRFNPYPITHVFVPSEQGKCSRKIMTHEGTLSNAGCSELDEHHVELKKVFKLVEI